MFISDRDAFPKKISTVKIKLLDCDRQNQFSQLPLFSCMWTVPAGFFIKFFGDLTHCDAKSLEIPSAILGESFRICLSLLLDSVWMDLVTMVTLCSS